MSRSINYTKLLISLQARPGSRPLPERDNWSACKLYGGQGR